jgi:hypothetical protein
MNPTGCVGSTAHPQGLGGPRSDSAQTESWLNGAHAQGAVGHPIATKLSSESQRRLNRLFPKLEVCLQAFCTGVVNNPERLQENVNAVGNVASARTSGLDTFQMGGPSEVPIELVRVVVRALGVCVARQLLASLL